MVHARLLDIAIREFGLKGLEGASTRGIAAAAGTAMSSITYHYGGKDGLYAAAADRIASRMADDMGPVLEADAIAQDDAPGARAAIQTILGRFADKMAGEASTDWALFIMREQMDPSPAFDRIYGGAMGQMLGILVSLVCVATGIHDLKAARIATITLFGQAVALRTSRAMCLRLLERPTLDLADIAAIKARIAANTDAILDRLHAEGQGTP